MAVAGVWRIKMHGHLSNMSASARPSTPTTTGQGGSSERKIHGISINEMVLDMSQFYEQMAQTKDASEAAVYRQIAKDISEEHATFDNSDPPGEAVTVEQHHEGLPGHGMLIEFCTSPDSMLGNVAKEYGIHVVRCTEQSLNVEQEGVIKSLEGQSNTTDQSETQDHLLPAAARHRSASVSWPRQRWQEDDNDDNFNRRRSRWRNRGDRWR